MIGVVNLMRGEYTRNNKISVLYIIMVNITIFCIKKNYIFSTIDCNNVVSKRTINTIFENVYCSHSLCSVYFWFEETFWA